jgi:2-methylisocitrate lyase-like PEP mutase family enzyme
MTDDLLAKTTRFRELHEREGLFLMPNAWDAGTARILAAAGFAALGTTSAGVNHSNGRTDYDYSVSRADMLADCGRIAAAVDLPVSGDLENGYGDSPEEVAETITESIRCGLAGGSIEDHSADPAQPLYELELAVARIRAAREAADASGLPYTLTARAETYLVGHPDAFGEAVRRVNRYREAGADCLFVPGVKDAETIGTLVREVDGPVNVVMGLVGAPLSLDQLAELGVKRISIGGSLARAAFAVVRRAAEEMRDHGTFGYAAEQMSDDELNALMRR